MTDDDCVSTAEFNRDWKKRRARGDVTGVGTCTGGLWMYSRCVPRNDINSAFFGLCNETQDVAGAGTPTMPRGGS